MFIEREDGEYSWVDHPFDAIVDRLSKPMETDYKHEIKEFPVPTYCLFGTINQCGEKYKTAILDAIFTGNDQLFSVGDRIYIVHADFSHVTTVHKDDIVRWICYHE